MVCFFVIVSCIAHNNADNKARNIPVDELANTGFMAMLIPTNPTDSARSFLMVIFSPKKYIARQTEATGVIELIEVARLTGILLIA